MLPILFVAVSSIVVILTIISTLQTIYAFVSVEKSNESVLLIDEKIIQSAIDLVEQNTILD